MVGRLAFALVLVPLLHSHAGPVGQDLAASSEAFVLKVATPSGRLFTVTIPAARARRWAGRTAGYWG